MLLYTICPAILSNMMVNVELQNKQGEKKIIEFVFDKIFYVVNFLTMDSYMFMYEPKPDVL